MAFQKLFCADCNAKTWHYKEGDKEPRCECKAREHASKVQGTIQGGSLYSRIGKEVPTEREIRIANHLDRSMWRIGEEQRASRVDISGEAWAQNLFPPSDEKPRDPNKNYCSFCRAETDQVNTLTERKPIIRRVQEAFKTSDGEVVMKDKVISRLETIHACPNCVLNIRKPIVVRKV